MGYRDIVLKKEEGVATLILNRPEKLNAWRLWGFCDELNQAFREVSQDSGARTLVITGAGRAFSVGGDIQDFVKLREKMDKGEVELSELIEIMRSFDRMILNLRNLEKPTIASVNGVAVGGGACLAIACDMVIASTEARFGWVFPRIGLSGADVGATYLLPRLVGLHRAFELLYTGKIIDAQEAERIGIVNKVVSPENLEAETRELAGRIVQGPPLALAMTKLALVRGLAVDFASDLDFELYVQTLCIQSEDHKEGIKAFIEKREPRFKGK